MQKPGFFSWSILMGLVIASLVLHFIPQQTGSQSYQPVASYAPAVNNAAPAVVNIYTSKTVRQQVHPLLNQPFFRRFFNRTPVPESRIQNSLGSGVIINDIGLILTNFHVIQGADEILIALQDGRTVNAKIVGKDRETDIALLKIDLEDLPVIEFSPQDLQVGDVTLAIGNPFGIGQTVTLGIVSATGRNQLGITTYEDFIQTDAAINEGNSGGALVNAYGQLVGINTAIYNSQNGGNQGIGFAIPLKDALTVARNLLEHGEVIRGWLGLETQEITPKVKTSFGLPDNLEGQVVVGVVTNGPAFKAGLQKGDIVTHFNGKAANKGTQTMRQIADLMPGDVITLGIIRGGKAYEIQATLGRRLNPQ